MSFNLRNTVVLCLFFSLLSACQSQLPEEPKSDKTAVFLYLAADNNLDYYAIYNMSQLEHFVFAHPDIANIYVYIDRAKGRKPSHSCLYRISADTTQIINSEILRVYPEQNSADETVFSAALNDVLIHCQKAGEKLRGLVLWSHGSAWLPETADLYSNRGEVGASSTSTRSFGVDLDPVDKEEGVHSEMSVRKLAEALRTFHFEFLLFDACFMSSIEVLYELKNSFDYIIASPTEILASGFPYKEIMEELFAPQIRYDKLCDKYISFYKEKSGVLSSAAVAVVKTSELEGFSSLMRDYISTQDILINDSILQYDLGRSGWLFDLKQLLTTVNGDEKERLLSQLEKLIYVYKHTEFFFNNIPLAEGCGVSIYLPNKNNEREKAHLFYETLSWGEDSGFNSLLSK